MEQSTKTRTYYDIQFTGIASEFFRIWIVNVLLSIVTLGIYSAWAKVRTQQYFYGNTQLDGSSFEYTANPVNILKGRLIAFALIVIYQAVSYFYPEMHGIALLVGVLLVPALIVMALRFRMRYSRWRGIHFNFDTDFVNVYLLFIPVLFYFALLAFAPFYFGIDQQQVNAIKQGEGQPENLKNYFLTLGILVVMAMLAFPWWQKAYYRFVANHTRYGTLKFTFLAHAMEFYALYFAAFLVFFTGLAATGIAIGVLFALSDSIAGIKPIWIAFTLLLTLLPYAMAAAYIQTARTNTIYSNLELGDIFFSSELKFKKMFYLYATNTIAILFTLGLAIPWARVRMAKYRAQTLRLFSYGFDHFLALQTQQRDALGEEISDVFDWDVGL